MDETPFISVIIPVYNDPEGIRTTIESVLKQTYPVDSYEILAVDNDSTDRTRSMIDAYATEHDHVEMLVEDEIQSSYAARNRGLWNANGDVIAFLDADVTVAPDWLERGVEELTEQNVDYLACNVTMYSVEDPTFAGEYNRRFDFDVERLFNDANFGPTCGLFVRASVFEEVGLFDERLISGGDGEFGARVHQAGNSQAFASDLSIYHPIRSTIQALLKREIRIGRGAYQRWWYYPERRETEARRLRSPRAVLPPRPWTIRDRCQGWSELTASERIGFYLLAYLLKLATTYGVAKQAIISRLPTTEHPATRHRNQR